MQSTASKNKSRMSNSDAASDADDFSAAQHHSESALHATHEKTTSISPGELASVCAHYDLGEIQSVLQYKRGSRKSPKVLLVCAQGRYLLKRRARGRDDPLRVALGQHIQQTLFALGFPTPRILKTTHTQNSILKLNGRIYELFDFVPGEPFDRTPEPCEHAGVLLATMHRMLTAMQTNTPAPTWSYHNDPRTRKRLKVIADSGTSGQTRAAVARTEQPITGTTPTQLLSAYRAASKRACDLLSNSSLPNPVTHTEQLLHGDWHPGNMIFQDGRVAAVLDFDTARMGLPITELANGLLQFSLARVGTNADDWPDPLDATRFASFMRGYASVAGRFDARALPALMAQAIIAEVAAPIAQTGTFGSLDAAPFLRMASRKAAWIMAHEVGLVGLAKRSMEQSA